MKKILFYIVCSIFLASPALATSPTDTFREILMQNAAAATGNGTSITVDYFTTVSVNVTITNTATITWEQSIDGVNWQTGYCIKSDSTTATPATTATVTGLYHCNLSALTLFRGRISSYTSGTVTAYARITPVDFNQFKMSGGGGGGGGVVTGTATPSDAFANPTTAILSMNFMMGWNGATWDRLQVDGSKFLKINCAVGCSGGASTPSDAFANPTTASLAMSFGMGWNGATWDRLQVDGSKFLKVVQQGTVTADTELPAAAAVSADAQSAPTAPGVYAYIMCFNGVTWDRCGGTKDVDDNSVAVGQTSSLVIAENQVYSPSTNDWRRLKGSPDGSMAIMLPQIADGQDVAEGSRNDAPASTLGGPASVIALLKAINLLAATIKTIGIPITNLPATQSVSGTVAVNNFPTSIQTTRNEPIGFSQPPCNKLRRTACQSISTLF
jgi:hypothetical protein